MKKFILLLLSFGIVFLSCSKFENLDETAINNPDAEFAVPIGKANFSIRDLVEFVGDSTFIFVDPDSTIRLNYRGDLTFEDAEGALFGAINEALDAIPFAPIEDSISTLPWIAPDGLEIDSMALKGGTLSFIVFSNPLAEPVIVNWQFDNAIGLDGDTLSGTLIIPPLALNFSDTIELESQTLLPIDGEIKFTYDASTLTEPNYVVPNFFVSIDSLSFSYAEGFFDNITYTGNPDIIELELFDEWTAGNIFFDNPEIKIFSENSFGIPTRAVINFFDVQTERFGDLPLESPVLDQIDFSFPRLSEIGKIARDTFIFNAANSNIEEILFGGPKGISYHVDAVTNPDSLSPIRGFVTCESFYKFIVEADLPLHGKTDGFAVTDTIDWDFSNYDEVSHAEFKIVTDNELGLEIIAQGYFLDENDVILDSLFMDKAESILTAATTDDDGFASGVANTVTFAPFSAERFSKIRSANRIAIDADFYSPERGTKSVRVQSNQDVEIRIGMKFGLN